MKSVLSKIQPFLNSPTSWGPSLLLNLFGGHFIFKPQQVKKILNFKKVIIFVLVMIVIISHSLNVLGIVTNNTFQVALPAKRSSRKERF
jgi:hypothetical protein